MYCQIIATSTHISRSSVVVTVHSRSRHPVGVAVTSSRGLRYFESGPSTVPDVNSSPTVPSSAESSVLSFTDKQEGREIDWSAAAEERSEEHTSELQSHSDLVCR